MSRVYYQGETIRQKAHVTDVRGIFITPDTIVITIKDPIDTMIENGKNMVEDEKGKYYYDYLIPSDGMIGKWRTEIKAIKGYTAIEQDEFTVVEGIA